LREVIIEHVNWIAEEFDCMGVETNLWICLSMERDFFTSYRRNDLHLLKVMFALSKYVLRALLVPLPEGSIDHHLVMIQSDPPCDPCRAPIRNKIVINGKHQRRSPLNLRRLFFCISDKVFYYFEYDVIRLFVQMTDDVDDMHFFGCLGRTILDRRTRPTFNKG